MNFRCEQDICNISIRCDLYTYVAPEELQDNLREGQRAPREAACFSPMCQRALGARLREEDRRSLENAQLQLREAEQRQRAAERRLGEQTEALQAAEDGSRLGSGQPSRSAGIGRTESRREAFRHL